MILLDTVSMLLKAGLREVKNAKYVHAVTRMDRCGAWVT